MADLNFLDSTKKKQQEVPEKKRGLFSFTGKKKRSLGVNLITTEAQKEVVRAVIRKNLIQLGVSFLIALLLALLVYGALLLYGSQQKARIVPLRQNLDQVEADIIKLEKENKKLLGFQTKLSAIKSLLDEHPTFLRFFDALEKNTLPEVSYDTLSISDDGTVSLSAGTASYTMLARQLLAFENAKDSFSSVRFSGIAASLDQLGAIIGVRFTVSLKPVPALFRPEQPKPE